MRRRDVPEYAGRDRFAMLPQAYQVSFDRLADVIGCFRTGMTLGNASGKCGASCHVHSVFIGFQIDSVLHYHGFYQSRTASILNAPVS